MLSCGAMGVKVMKLRIENDRAGNESLTKVQFGKRIVNGN